jgi:hypothetical protein
MLIIWLMEAGAGETFSPSADSIVLEAHMILRFIAVLAVASAFMGSVVVAATVVPAKACEAGSQS